MSKTKKPQHLRGKEVCGREREDGYYLKTSCIEREEELKRFLSQPQPAGGARCRKVSIDTASKTERSILGIKKKTYLVIRPLRSGSEKKNQIS